MGLTGLPDAIAVAWPQTMVRACIVAQAQQLPLRLPQGWAAIARDLKPADTPTEAAALDRFAEFSATCEARYPTIVRLWGHASLAGEVTASRDV